MSAQEPVTVVVPVHRGAADVRRCLESLLLHGSEVSAQVLVVDDASPDDDVQSVVAEIATRQSSMPVRAVRNASNQGFVRTVNWAFEQAAGDVVVLNADTVVTAGWLDRLAAAAAEPDVATVTPLTNFGSICTVPPAVIEAFGLDSEHPQIDECAAFVVAHSLKLRPEVVSGVGFCMYVTRRALDLCGGFDDRTFGSGYGEEVDFCLRATRLGLRHLVEDDTFVYHRGAGSFGDARRIGLERSSALIHDRYRFFRGTNTRERRENPLAPCFAALELGLVARSPERCHVLQVLHSHPDAVGGTERHLRSLITALKNEFDFSILYPVESGFVLRSIWSTDAGETAEHELLLPGGPRRVTKIHDETAAGALDMALDLYEFDAIHIQNILGHSLAPLKVLSDFVGPVVYSVRDLYLACPNHSLLYLNEQACGIPEDLEICARCLPRTTGLDVAYLREFRETVRDQLDTVDHWVFASQSAADFLLRVYDIDAARIHLIPHGALIDSGTVDRTPDEMRILEEPLRLAFVGMGWAKKGLGIVNQLAQDLPIEIHHFGELKEAPAPQLRAHGPYEPEKLPRLLRDHRISIVILPGPYAETFGHVMTEALVAGLPVIGASYGALGERIRTHGVGWTIDPSDLGAIAELVQHLDQCRIEVLRATHNAAKAPIASVAQTAHLYAELYRGGSTQNS